MSGAGDASNRWKARAMFGSTANVITSWRSSQLIVLHASFDGAEIGGAVARHAVGSRASSAIARRVVLNG
jgi:hypothetical protein